MNLKGKFAAALSALLLCGASSAVADEVGMRTSVPVGQTLTLALNTGVHAQLDWGDGNPVDFAFTGFPQEITVKSDSLLIKTDQTITLVYCPGNGLKTLNLSGARSIVTLICNDNELTRMDLYSNKKVEEVNCQRNAITYIRVNNCPDLISLNCSQNPLSTLTLGSKLTKLKTLACAEMNLKSLSLSYQKQLQTLWCQENNLTKLAVTSCPKLRSLVAFGNQIATLDLSKNTELKNLWVDYNELTTLDLSNNLLLETVSVDHNAISDFTISKDGKDVLDYFYANDNNLVFSQLPTVYSTAGGGKNLITAFNVANQGEFEIVPAVSINENIDLTSILNKNAWGTTLTYSYAWKRAADDTELVKGTDYKQVKKGVYAFLQPVGDAYIEITSGAYPGLTLRSTVVKAMTDATAVERVDADEVKISVDGSALVVNTTTATRINVVKVDGRQVLNTKVSAGSYRWTLPAGVYIVNGSKVLIGR